MLELLDIGIERAVAYHLQSKVTEEDMTLALSAIKEKIEQYGEVFLYQEVEEFSGVEFTAILAKFNFLFEHGIKDITRVAVVTDKEWLHKIIDVEDTIFKNIDMQCFALKDKQKALAFLAKNE